MKRWYFGRMVEVEPGEIVPKVATYPNVNHRTWSKDGVPFCLGQLATNDLTKFDGDPDIKIIPDAALDNMLNTIPTSTRNAMTSALTAAGFDVSAVRGTWSLRGLLKHLKLQLQSDDNIEAGDVRDIES